MSLSLLSSSLQISFWCVRAYELFKESVSNCFDVVSLIIKSFLLLVDCKIFKQ